MNKKQIINSIFYPRKSYRSKDGFDRLIDVDKDVCVGARFFLKDENFDNIIFFHGNAELAEEYMDIAAAYQASNFNLIVADYRGYGLSDGSPNKDNLLSDALKIFDYTQNSLKDMSFRGRKIIMGRSLGSASACEILFNREEFIDACVIESGFATEYSLLELMNIAPDSIDFNLSDGFENLRKLKKYSKPMFVIHAEKDHIIPLSEGELMHGSVLSKNKKILVVESANHNNIMYHAGNEYFRNIRDFIDSI